MSQLRHLKEVGGQTAHQLACPIFIVKIKAQRLHMGEKIPADVRLHPDAKGMAPVAHHIIEYRPQQKRRQHRRHHQEERPVEMVGQPLVHGDAGYHGKGKVNKRNQKSAGHIHREQPAVGLKVGQKHPQGRRLADFVVIHAGISFFQSV